MSKPDTHFGLVPGVGGWLGIDATKYSGNIGEQFYVTPDGRDRGPYESPVVYTGTLNGMLMGVVEYSDGKYPSCAFAVEVLS